MPSEQGLQHWWVWKASIVQGAQDRCWLLETRRGRHRIHKASLVFSCRKLQLLPLATHSICQTTPGSEGGHTGSDTKRFLQH